MICCENIIKITFLFFNNMKGSNSKRGETSPEKKDNGQPSTDLNDKLDNVGFNSKPTEGQVDAILIERQG